MKRLGELMRREPTPEERDALDAVVEIAHAWKRNEIDLRGVRSACTGYERWQAMRFAELGSTGKTALMELAEALVNEDPTGVVTPTWIVTLAEAHDPSVKKVRNHDGARVMVWPMHSMNGEPYYPRVDLPRGEDRMAREQSAMVAYSLYRKGKRPAERKRWEGR